MSSLISIITPAYNEAQNLPLVFERLSRVFEKLVFEWEWIIVDDHSSDNTFETIRQIVSQDNRVRGIRLSRNFGSHIAIICGLQNAQGDCVTIMAADLQDPPEILPELFAKWQEGAQVIWAVRARREFEKASTRGFSRLYHLIMSNIVGIKEMPATGADFFMIDRQVVNAFRQFKEGNVSILALITWMGFRQTSITYDKQPRLHGRSNWSLGRKVKLAIDSIMSFSFFPIRLMSYLGFAISLLGFLYASFIVVHAISGQPLQGWSSLIVVVLVIGGIQILMMGILGEYLWRTLDEARRRPRYLIEAVVNAKPSQEQERNEA